MLMKNINEVIGIFPSSEPSKPRKKLSRHVRRIRAIARLIKEELTIFALLKHKPDKAIKSYQKGGI